MKIIICDDDIQYVQTMECIIKSVLDEQQIHTEFKLYSDSSKLAMNIAFFDIAFLDIEMPVYSGIDIAHQLKKINPYIIIFFITSYDQYLDDAMDINVFRYINKPLDQRRLKSGILKALEQIDNHTITFFLKQGKLSKSIRSDDIVYIETVGHATKVVTTDNAYLSNHKISFWTEKLIASFFYQVHKSFIINIKHLTDYQRDNITLLNKYNIPIAYRKQADFRSYFFSYIGGQ